MTYRILIIDDEVTLAHFLAQSLGQEGHQVRLAHTGGQGLAALAQGEFDLVLLDLKLPDMTGLDVLRVIRRSQGGLPVIMMSSEAGVESAVEAIRLGALDYLVKPLDLSHLKRSIARALTTAPVSEGGDQATSIREDDHPPQTVVATPVASPPGASPAAVGEARLEEFTFSLLKAEGLHEVAQLGASALGDLGGGHRVALYIGYPPFERYGLAELRHIPPQALTQAAWQLPAQSLAHLSAEPTPLEGIAPPPELEALLANYPAEPKALVPLASETQVVGWALVLNPPGRPFSARQMGMLWAIGARLGTALERNSQEEELRQQAAELRGLRASASASRGTLSADLEGVVRFANPAAQRLLGSPVEGRSVGELLGRFPGLERESLRRGAVVPRWETSVGDRLLALRISVLRGEGQQVSGVVIELEDRTEARATEEEKRRLERTALLGELAGVVAHEIRNPLAGIGAGLQHMLSQLRPGDALYEDAQRVLQESRHLDRMLEDILSAARPFRLNLAPCDLAIILDEVLQQRQTLLEAQRIVLARHFADGPVSLRGDPLRLRDVFDRLILNAVEAMPEGGSLEISLQDSDEEALVMIRDSGPGLRDGAARPFEPFYTTKAGHPGLGLTIARRVVEAHGGAIEVDSAVGQGSTFRVRLPRTGS